MNRSFRKPLKTESWLMILKTVKNFSRKLVEGFIEFVKISLERDYSLKVLIIPVFPNLRYDDDEEEDQRDTSIHQ